MNRQYDYLIVGGGMAADAAARGIREVDTQGSIGLIGAEPDPPYNRPPLSKGLWRKVRPTPLARIWRNTASLGVDLHLGRSATRLDPRLRQVADDQADTYQYRQLLLATGGEPIRISPEHDRVIYYRTLGDYQRLRSLVGDAQRFVVIGGGFIGSEMAAVLSTMGKDVTMLFPEPGIAARVLPAALSDHLSQVFTAQSVRLLPGRLAQAVTPDEQGVTLITQNGENLRADVVVAGLGIRPNDALARDAGLVTGNGIHVDAYLSASAPGIYAAGDVANFYSPVLDMRMRVEHEEHANLSGLLAGRNMAGQRQAYETLPSVYSSMFDLNYDAVGDLNPAYPVVYDWQEPFQKGVLYYLKDARVRGVLLWNVSRGLEAARALIGEPGPLAESDLRGRITG